uniref:Uncharacterized protein n=2 Tax=Ovis aries TaxID=9940 RepID=A0AC11D2J4_SHEEP
MLRAGDRVSWSAQPLLTLEGDARVVDQHVEAPVLLAQEVAHGADALPVIDVQLVETGAQALCLQLLHGRPTLRLVRRREHHVPLELPAQFTHDGEADALAGPGDQCYAGGGRHGLCAGRRGAFRREPRLSVSELDAGHREITRRNHPGAPGLSAQAQMQAPPFGAGLAPDPRRGRALRAGPPAEFSEQSC